MVCVTMYGFTDFKDVVSPIHFHTSIYDGMGIHVACHPMDAPLFKAFIPDASELAPGLLQFLGYCVMVEGPLTDYALRNLYANKVVHKSLKTMQKAAVNEARLTLAYWLIVLPDMRYNLKNTFSRDATTLRATTTHMTLRGSDSSNFYNTDLRSSVVTWCVAFGEGRFIGSKTEEGVSGFSDDDDEKAARDKEKAARDKEKRNKEKAARDKADADAAAALLAGTSLSGV